MPLIDGRTTRILFTVSLFAVGVGFFYIARRTLIAFMFAVFFAYLVDPAVSRVEKWTKGRGSAIAVIYVLIVLFLGTFFFFVGPKIGHETQKLTESLPALLERVTSGQLAEQIGAEHGLSIATRRQLADFLTSHRDDLLHLAQRVGLRVAEVAQQSWLLILVPILAGFFLKDGRAFSQVALSFVHTKPQREFLQGVISDMNQMLADLRAHADRRRRRDRPYDSTCGGWPSLHEAVAGRTRVPGGRSCAALSRWRAFPRESPSRTTATSSSSKRAGPWCRGSCSASCRSCSRAGRAGARSGRSAASADRGRPGSGRFSACSGSTFLSP